MTLISILTPHMRAGILLMLRWKGLFRDIIAVRNHTLISCTQSKWKEEAQNTRKLMSCFRCIGHVLSNAVGGWNCFYSRDNTHGSFKKELNWANLTSLLQRVQDIFKISWGAFVSKYSYSCNWVICIELYWWHVHKSHFLDSLLL